jgi:hypothetical protein
MGRLKSNCCCIYVKPHRWDESDDSERETNACCSGDPKCGCKCVSKRFLCVLDVDFRANCVHHLSAAQRDRVCSTRIIVAVTRKCRRHRTALSRHHCTMITHKTTRSKRVFMRDLCSSVLIIPFPFNLSASHSTPYIPSPHNEIDTIPHA